MIGQLSEICSHRTSSQALVQEVARQALKHLDKKKTGCWVLGWIISCSIAWKSFFVFAQFMWEVLAEENGWW